MMHAFTYLHFANGFLLIAALSAAVLWSERKILVVVLVSLQCFSAGLVAKSEILMPFYRGAIQSLSAGLCEIDRQQTLEMIKSSTSTSTQYLSSVSQRPSLQQCDTESTVASVMLRAIVYFVKSTIN
jgi:hypothetical protein